jgi:hypothetical protein
LAVCAIRLGGTAKFYVAGDGLAGVGQYPVYSGDTAIEAATLGDTLLYQDTSGDWHVACHYTGETASVVDCNLTDGTTWLTAMPYAVGFIGYDATNDAIITSRDGPQIGEINAQTGAYEVIGSPTLAKGAYKLAWGLDGLCYIGCYGAGGTGGEVLVFDPTTKVMTSLGVPDSTQLGFVYAYDNVGMCADGWIYVSILYGDPPGLLAMYDPVAEDWTVQIAAGDGSSLCRVWRHTDGYAYAKQDSRTFKLDEGVLTEVSGPGAITETVRTGGDESFGPDWETLSGFEISFDEMDATSETDPELLYRVSGSGDPMTSKTWSGISTIAKTLYRGCLDPGDSNTLIAVCQQYSPLVEIDLTTEDVTYIGSPQYSIYGVDAWDGDIGNGSESLVVIGGYTALSMLWRRDEPYTLSESNNAGQGEGNVNPWWTHGHGKYAYYQAIDGAGMVASAWTHIRGEVGGSASLYDAATDTEYYERDEIGETYSPRGIAFSPDGSKVAISLNDRTGGDGKIHILDVATWISDDYATALDATVTVDWSTSAGRVRWIDNSTIVSGPRAPRCSRRMPRPAPSHSEPRSRRTPTEELLRRKTSTSK